MPTATHRAIIIQDHTCKHCGNRWTHSYAILTDSKFSFWGGTPIAFEADLPLISINHRVSQPQNGCFRCALALIPKPNSPGPTAPQQSETATKPKPFMEPEPDDLLNL